MSNQPPREGMSDVTFVVLLILFLIAVFLTHTPTPAKHDGQGAKTYKT